MSDISCDYETKSGADIKRGLPVYLNDPQADVLTFQYRVPGGEITCWEPGMPNPQELFDHVAAGGRCRAWNAAFEHQVWNRICAPKYGWPAIDIAQWVDTMAQAAAMNLPQALGNCGEALALPLDQLKSKRGKYLISKLCKPQKPTKNQPLQWLTKDTHPELHAELREYCRMDVVAEEAIARKLRPLSEFEQRIWVLTHRINLAGVPLAVDEVRNIKAVVAAETDRLNAELREITGQTIDGVKMKVVPRATNRAGLLRWFEQHPRLSGLSAVWFEGDDADEGADPLLADMRGATVDEVLQRTDLPNDVRRVLEIRRQVVQTSTAKFPKLLSIVARDGTLKGLLSYHGASTGRWASRGGVNLQNLARPTMSALDIATAHELLGNHDHANCVLLFGDDLMRAAVCCLRGVIKAPPGFEFIDADLSGVENRVASWLAGQQDKLDAFAEGLDEYRVFAAKHLFHCEYDEVTKDQRQKTKPVILGGIFGLGAQGLVDYAKAYAVEMTLEEAKVNIKALRTAYAKVAALWYTCGDASIAAVRNPGQWKEAGPKLSLLFHRKALWMKLPSGRLISWSRPRIENLLAPWTEKIVVGYDVLDQPIVEERPVYRDVVTVEGVDTFTRKWQRSKLIGSSIMQSATQATARDILAQGVVNATDAGFDIRLLVHDEILALAPIGARTSDELGARMVRRASWFEDLPLAFEGWVSTRFQK